MMGKHCFVLLIFIFIHSIFCLDVLPDGGAARNYTLTVLLKIVDPVLTALSQHKLRASLPVAAKNVTRQPLAPMEAFTRSFVGLSPWLELKNDSSTIEAELRRKYRHLVLLSIDNMFNERSPDFIDWKIHMQSVVELAFLAQGLLRAEESIWKHLTPEKQRLIMKALIIYRDFHQPYISNWLLFESMIEGFLLKHRPELVNATRLNETLTMYYERFYLGDGVYGDGKYLQTDYYNSFVIHPILMETLRIASKYPTKNAIYERWYQVEIKRFRRWADIQEQIISPEGTFPVIGRSPVYRHAALQGLSLAALLNLLPDKLKNKQGGVRNALTTVIQRMTETRPIFDANGWLVEGVIGEQHSMINWYITRGSLYLCTAGFLHLGLPSNHEFWTAPNEAWTQKAIWEGSQDVVLDHAIH